MIEFDPALDEVNRDAVFHEDYINKTTGKKSNHSHRIY